MNRLRLGGWWRLWILLSVIYGVFIAVLMSDVPKSAPPPTVDEFHSRLSKESLNVIARSNKELDDWIKQLPDAKLDAYTRAAAGAVTSEAPIKYVKTSEGFEYALPSDVTKDESERIRAEYDALMASKLSEVRWTAFRSAFLLWAIPCVFVLLVGLAAGWVYRGFRGRIS